MKDLLIKYPELIQHGNTKYLAKRVGYLQSYVTTPKNVWRLMMSSPILVVESEKVIEAKMNYLIKVMGIEVHELTDSDVFSNSLDHIKIRHTFLERLGMFKFRTEKMKENNEKNINPKLSHIMDTSDKSFASKICYVTLEEYETFQELIKREWKRTDVNDDEEEFDEMQSEQGIDRVA